MDPEWLVPSVKERLTMNTKAYEAMPTPYFCHANSHETYLVEGGQFAHSSMATVDVGGAWLRWHP